MNIWPYSEFVNSGRWQGSPPTPPKSSEAGLFSVPAFIFRGNLYPGNDPWTCLMRSCRCRETRCKGTIPKSATCWTCSRSVPGSEPVFSWQSPKNQCVRSARLRKFCSCLPAPPILDRFARIANADCRDRFIRVAFTDQFHRPPLPEEGVGRHRIQARSGNGKEFTVRL